MDPNSDPSAAGTGGAVATRLRVAVADDDTLLREGLASLLVGSGFEIVGLVGDAVDLLAVVRDTSPVTWSSLTFGCRRPIPRKD